MPRAMSPSAGAQLGTAMLEQGLIAGSVGSAISVLGSGTWAEALPAAAITKAVAEIAPIQLFRQQINDMTPAGNRDLFTAEDQIMVTAK
jgi:hypothetical protein